MGAGGEAGGREARLAAFLAESRWEDVPAPMRHEAKRAFLNIAGCLLAGRRAAPVRLIEKTFSPGELLNAATLYAAAANAYDFDDTHLPTVLHPGPPVAGALLALAEKHPVSGPRFLHAYLLGVEAACRVANAVSVSHYEHGWHITGTCGVFGAAAAAGRLLHLSAVQMHVALGLAATQAAGLVEMLNSPARLVNAGFAARNGLAAAMLAREGFACAARPLEGRRGFLAVYGGANDAAALTEGLGRDWELAKVAYKPYPCGVVLHALIDACLQLRTASPANRVLVKLHPLAIERADRPEPRDAGEARLSAQHCAAVALLYGRAGLEEFGDAALADPQVRRLRAKVAVSVDPGIDKAAAIVDVDGRQMRAEPRIAMSDAELEAKFAALAGARAPEWRAFVSSLESAGVARIPDCGGTA